MVCCRLLITVQGDTLVQLLSGRQPGMWSLRLFLMVSLLVLSRQSIVLSLGLVLMVSVLVVDKQSRL